MYNLDLYYVYYVYSEYCEYTIGTPTMYVVLKIELVSDYCFKICVQMITLQ